MENGIEAARLRPVTYGSEVPLQFPGVEESRNRRVHLFAVADFGDYRSPVVAGATVTTSREIDPGR